MHNQFISPILITTSRYFFWKVALPISLKSLKTYIVCVHPGMVRTKLGRQAGWFSRTIFHLLGQPIEKGANTHRFVISEPAGQLQSGGFYEKSQLGKTKTKESNDLELAKKLNQAINHYLNQIVVDW